MMKTAFELNAQIRKDIGKGASRRLRHTELVPAIIYGAKKEPTLVSLKHDDLVHALENEAFFSHILTLNIGKEKESVVLKDLQRHPYKRRLLHVDFLRISADEELHMHVPLHFTGEDMAPGFKLGGVITHHMKELEVSCLPANLPEYIAIDVSQLNMGDAIHLKDIAVPKGITLLAMTHGDGDQPVVAIHAARATKAEDEGAPVAPTEETKEKTEG